MNKLKNYLVILIAALWLMTSCNKDAETDYEVEYLPFQADKNGNWGMIGVNGEVLFSEEFTSEPSVAVNGRFLVQNASGMWEIYTTDPKPKKIGNEYLQAGLFYEDVAPVVEVGQPIKLIDRDGKLKATLDKINGKAITRCTNFINGQAKVEVDGYWGVIDTNGDVVIEPNYIRLADNSQGYYLALDKKFEGENDRETLTYSILDEKGKEVCTVKGSKIDDFKPVNTSYRTIGCIVNEALIAQTRKGNERAIGLMDFNGEWKLSPTNKANRLLQNRGQYFIFSNNDGLGMMDEKGEEVIRPKFSFLCFADKDILMGRKSRNDDITLYDLNEEVIGKDKYMDVKPFYDGAHAFAKVGNHDYVIINKQGEKLKLETDIYELGGSPFVPELFESDFLDLDLLVSTLHFEKDGFMGFKTGMSGLQAVNTANAVNAAISTDAQKHDGRPFIEGKIKVNKVQADLAICTFGLIEKKNSSSGWLTYSNYAWTPNPVQCYNLSFNLDKNSQLKGKMKELYAKIMVALKEKGNVLMDGKNAAVINAGNDYSYYIGWAGKEVFIFFGKFNLSTCIIDDYDNATEEELSFVQMPELSGAPMADDEEDWGDLESPPADDL